MQPPERSTAPTTPSYPGAWAAFDDVSRGLDTFLFPWSLSPHLPTLARVQTGVRIERRILKVLKALAEYHDISLGDLREGIVLHAFEGQCAFTDEGSLERIAAIKQVYGLDLTAADSHQLREEG